MAGYKETDAPTKLINRLKEATKDYSLESVKAALAQSTLNKKQIESILAQKGMQGELLKTTADEIANAASTKAVARSQKEANASTNSLSLAFKGLGNKISTVTKKMWTFMTTTPAGWITAVVAAIGAAIWAGSKAEDVWQDYLNSLKEGADKSDELIKSYSDQISELQNLQKKLNETASSGGNLVNIYDDLTDVVGSMPKLLEGESEAVEIANLKLKDRITLLEEEEELERQKKQRNLEEYYENNVVPNKAGFDVHLYKVRDKRISFDNTRNHHQSELEEFLIKSKVPQEIADQIKEYVASAGIATVGDIFDYIKRQSPELNSAELYDFLTKRAAAGYLIDAKEFQKYFDKQTEAVFEAYSDIISSYDGGIFTDQAIKSLIAGWVEQDFTIDQIRVNLKDVLNNTQLQEAVNDFYSSFYDPDIDTETALNAVRLQLSLLEDKYPQLKEFVNNFYKRLFELKKEDIEPPPPITFSDIFSFKDSNGELTKLGELSEQLDNIQNAYKTLSEAVNEYQTNGSYSVDTLQKIMELGDDWLDYLVDENGELKLDTEAVEGLASARLNEMKIRVQNSLLDRISDIKDEATANKFLESTNYALADSMEQVAKRKSEIFKNLQNDPDISDETYAAVEEAAEKGWEFINNLVDNTSASLSALGGTTMSSVMSDIGSCADLIGNVNKELAENGEISFNTLQSIVGSYPELEKYVNNYMGGVEGSQL